MAKPPRAGGPGRLLLLPAHRTPDANAWLSRAHPAKPPKRNRPSSPRETAQPKPPNPNRPTQTAQPKPPNRNRPTARSNIADRRPNVVNPGVHLIRGR